MAQRPRNSRNPGKPKFSKKGPKPKGSPRVERAENVLSPEAARAAREAKLRRGAAKAPPPPQREPLPDRPSKKAPKASTREPAKQTPKVASKSSSTAAPQSPQKRTQMPAEGRAPKPPVKAAPKLSRIGGSGGEATRCGRIAILGRPNVGKSTLLNALVGERIAITSHHPQTTRNNLAGYFVRGASQFVFIDTPGIHQAKNALGSRMNAFAEGEASQADVVLFVTDLRESVLKPGALPEDAIDERDVAIAKKQSDTGVPMVIAINKIDRVKEKAKLLPILAAFNDAFPDAKALVPISGRLHDGLDALVSALEEHLPEGPFAFGEDELTDRPARYFVSEFIREQVLKRTREEVPHGVAVLVERFDDSKPTLHVDVVIYVDKESHKPILLGRGGLVLREIGTMARLRLEEMLERKVHLATVVRVDPRWYERAARLDELGYEG
ncbi:MAG: GTPase Era [Polyangiaceae bacterium]